MLKTLKLKCLVLISSALISSIAFASTTNLFGKTENDTYVNDYFGFTVKFPKNWHSVSREQMKKLSLAGRKIAFGNDSNLKALLDSGIKKIYLFQVSKKLLGELGNSMITANAIKVPSTDTGIATGPKYLEAVKYAFKNMSRIKPSYMSKITTTKINGTSFGTMSIKLNFGRATVNETFYSRIYKGFALLFLTVYTNPKDEKTLNQCIQTIKFKS